MQLGDPRLQPDRFAEVASRPVDLPALEELRLAVRLDGTSVPARNNLGTLLGMRGDLDAAIEQFREAIRLRPDHASSHFNLGSALARAGRLDEAVEEFRFTLALQPDHAGARRGRAAARA